MKRILKQFSLAIFLLLASCNQVAESNTSSYPVDNKEVKSQIKQSFDIGDTRIDIQKILDTGEILVLNKKLYALPVLNKLYENRAYQAVWTDFENINQALNAIEEISADGLDPEDYHFSILKTYFSEFQEQASISTNEFATFDILLSDALLLISSHIITGKVHPESLKNQWMVEVQSYKRSYEEVADLVDSCLMNYQIYQLVESLKPHHYMYTGLKKILQEFEEYQKMGGWDFIPEGNTLKLGMKDERVLAVRARLLASEEMEPYIPMNDSLYDSILFNNMKSFQKRYGIEVDGFVGKGTLHELNQTVEQRIDQIKANLERGRWVLYNVESKFIAVNIAGFELYFVDGAKELLTSAVMVGKYHTQTPIFKDTIQYIVFNPTWTVPRSLNATYLKKLKEDQDYLIERNMIVVTMQGQEVPLNSKDWSQYNLNNFPYMFRQKAGPGNALGEMKFMFPNKYSVYLHDTPARSLFSKDSRAFSHGCIRTKEIYQLAELLLEPNQDGWDQTKIKSIIETRKTSNVSLTKKIPIMLLYWTAGIGFKGNPYFKPDIYKRDQELINALYADPVY